MTPLVSVVVPYYNGGAFVSEAVASALSQTYPHVEVIVVDDGSHEPLDEALGWLRDSVRIVRQPNRGVAAARNAGIRAARGEFIALLDQDDLWLPHKLERQVNALLAAPDAALAHADVIYLDEPSGRRSARNSTASEFSGRCYERLFDGNAIATCTVLVRRRCLDAVGLFDEHIYGTDDYDLELRLARRFPFRYIPEPLAIYRRHTGNWSKRQLQMAQNELAVIRKLVADDSELPGLVGAPAIKDRIVHLLFAIAYSHFNAGQFVAARSCFKDTLRYRVQAWPALLLASTVLPVSLIRMLRRVKQKVRWGRLALLERLNWMICGAD